MLKYEGCLPERYQEWYHKISFGEIEFPFIAERLYQRLSLRRSQEVSSFIEILELSETLYRSLLQDNSFSPAKRDWTYWTPETAAEVFHLWNDPE